MDTVKRVWGLVNFWLAATIFLVPAMYFMGAYDRRAEYDGNGGMVFSFTIAVKDDEE